LSEKHEWEEAEWKGHEKDGEAKQGEWEEIDEGERRWDEGLDPLLESLRR